MANSKVQMDFKKGDDQQHFFQIESSAYEPGSVLWFTAKPAIDNDGGDNAAVINKSFADTAIVGALDEDSEMYLEGFVTWQLDFEPADIVNVSFQSGEKSKKYLGEFELITGTGVHQSFPADDQYIEVIIYADVHRGNA